MEEDRSTRSNQSKYSRVSYMLVSVMETLKEIAYKFISSYCSTECIVNILRILRRPQYVITDLPNALLIYYKDDMGAEVLLVPVSNP